MMAMTPYQNALKHNREEIVTNIDGLEVLLGRREMEIVAATADIAMLRKSVSFHKELITQIDLQLNMKEAS